MAKQSTGWNRSATNNTRADHAREEKERKSMYKGLVCRQRDIASCRHFEGASRLNVALGHEVAQPGIHAAAGFR